MRNKIYFHVLSLHLFSWMMFAQVACVSSPGVGGGNAALENIIASANPKSEWRPGRFRDLIVGRSLRKELLALLGKPKFTNDLDSPDLPSGDRTLTTVDEFDYADDFLGRLVASSAKKTGVITYIAIYPERGTLAQIQEIFGTDFVRTRYSHLVCPEDEGASRLIEDAEGEVELIEYRSKGVVISARGDKIDSIEFVKGSIESPNKRCGSK